VFVAVNLTQLRSKPPETQIVYKYIPKTFDEIQQEQPFVSDLFKTMFTEQTPWVNSVMDYDRRKNESINAYYVSQV
jgi:hypothetical protein